jgi:hypothetical protein
MLDSLHLKNVGPAPRMDLELAPRLNLITDDNGLGMSFLLDVAWWALTRTWAGAIALPTTPKRASITYVVQGKRGAARPVASTFRRETQTWPVDAKRPPMPGIVVYVRIDGGFSVWDPARNYWRKDPLVQQRITSRRATCGRASMRQASGYARGSNATG